MLHSLLCAHAITWVNEEKRTVGERCLRRERLAETERWWHGMYRNTDAIIERDLSAYIILWAFLWASKEFKSCFTHTHTRFFFSVKQLWLALNSFHCLRSKAHTSNRKNDRPLCSHELLWGTNTQWHGRKHTERRLFQLCFKWAFLRLSRFPGKLIYAATEPLKE